MAGIQDWYDKPLQDTQLGDATTFERDTPAMQPLPKSTFQKWATGELDEKKLDLSMQQARKQNPDLRAEVFQLQGKTGLPADLIQRNLDMVRERVKASDFNAKQFRQDFPKLAGVMEDPDNAALAHDDLESLQILERTLNRERFEDMGTFEWLTKAPAAAYRQGRLAEQRNFLAFQQLMGGSEDEKLEARLTELEGKLGQDFGADSWLGGALTSASEFLPSTLSGLTAGFETGVMGAVAGGGTALLAGQAGPQIATPEELITVPGAAALGFAAGSRVGAAEYAFRQEAGGAYREFKKFRDEDGNPLDNGAATVAAVIAGGVNSGLELFGLESLVKSFPGGQEVLEGVSRESVKAALARPTVRQAFAALGKRFAGVWSVQTLTEVMQEGVTILGGEIAKTIDPDEFEGITAEQAQERLTEAFTQAAQGMALLSAPGPLTSFAKDYGRARNARQTSEAMEALGEGARASKLRERLPSKYRDIVAKLRENGPIEAIQVPVERWNELFQSQNLDPAEVANEVIGNYQQYAEAMATGGDLVIPVEVYAEKLAASDYHEVLADNARFRPGDMTPREAREWLANAPQQAQQFADEMRNQPADTSQGVYDDIFGQLIAAGRDQTAADREAQLTQSVFRSLGERVGVDPMELYQGYNINVRRPLPEILQRPGNDIDTQLDPLIDRLRAGDIPSQRDAFGPSLLDFLRDQGIRDDGGELAARDIDAGRKAFQRSLIRDEGRSLDDAAQAAAEALYLPDRDRSNVTEQDLLDAIDREMRGQPVYALDRRDSQVETLRDTLEQLGDYLEEVGADLDAMDNETIKALLRGESRPVPGDATTLNQEVARRGRITFPQSREFFSIELLEKADLSTFLHESGHLYLEILTDLASREDAPQQLRDDYQTILEWFGTDTIGTEQHEQWARGFEAYLMEGNAPSADLRSVFARFRAWLVGIYRTLSSLNVELTDEVRGVMDRLVATDQEIADARDEAGYRPLFTDAAAAGMSDAEYAAYQKAADGARSEAEADLTGRVMREYQREKQAWWRDAKAQMRESVAAEVNQQPVYVAMAVLGRGKMADGSPLPDGMEPFKLSKRALVEMYGEPFLKRLPRPYVYSREGGIHPDQAAEVFGYRSGDQLVQAMIEARPRKKLIEAETDARMRAEYGDMLNDGSLADAAMDAVHNDMRANVMQAELRSLARRSRRQPTPSNILKDAAQRIVAEKRVRDLKPALYLRAEQKASREAFDAVARGDYAQATEAKQRQLLNHHLYRESRNAREEVDKAVAYFNRFDKRPTRERIGKAGGEYLAQIDALLTRYEFKKGVSLRRIDRRRSLDAWIQEQQAEGYTVDVPEAVADDARIVNYKEVPVEELRGLRDAVRQIEHLASTKNRLLADQRKRDFESTVDSVVSTIDAYHKRSDKKPPLHEDWKDKMASWAEAAHGWHTKPEFLFRWLDGDREVGPVWQAMFKPIADAETREQQMQAEATKRLADIMDVYTRQERATWYAQKRYVKEIGQSMDKARMMAVALNWGNQYNREVLMEGHGWNETQVQAILSHLDGRDWETVQAIWDLIDSFWPDIKKMEEDLNGVAPDKVQPAPVETHVGQFRGGYYPIKYDTRISYRAFQREEKAGQSLFENSFTRPATRKGHTKERTGSGGQALRLDLDVMSEHIGQVIHDLSHRRAIMDVNRLANDVRIREAIEQTAGREMYKQIKPWLQSVANEVLQPESYWEKLIGQARVGATVVNMGLKVTTAIVQPLGYLNSVDMLGERYAWKGLTDFLGSRGGSVSPWTNMKRATEFVQSRSTMMENRQRTFDRDVRDSLQRLTKENRIQEWQRSFFYFTGLMDMAVSVPTWLGAYRKAMEGGVVEIEPGGERAAIDYADSVVRQTQSSGGAKDLARIQRGGQVQRSFVMFYSYFSVLYNQFSRQISRVKRGDISLPRLAASAMYLWFAPSILGEMIAARGPEDDEEWTAWAARQGILYPMGAVVGLRDVGNAVLTPFGYDASPAFDAFVQTARTAQIPLKAIDDEDEVGRSDVKAAVLTAGYWGKLPARQAWITGEYLYDLATGQDKPESPQEFVRDLFFSRPADER